MSRNQRIPEKRFLIFVLLMLICVLGIGLPKQYAVRFLPDEFGYWSYAAKVLGYDWSNLVSLGMYYSFGYSLILLPIMYLFENAVFAYRAAIVVNAMLLVISGIGLYYIGNFLLEDEAGQVDFPKKSDTIFYASITAFYPGYLFYMQVTMAEIVLMTSFIMICVMFISYIKKTSIGRLIGIILFALWMYSIHMRSVGVLIALVIAIGTFSLTKKNAKTRRHFVMLILCLLFGLLILTELKNISKEILWATASEKNLKSNDYYGRWDTIVSVFTSWEQLKNFLIGVVGKLFYLIGATGGLFIWGMYYLIKKIKEEWHREEQKNPIRIFLVLTTLAAFGITAISMRSGRIDLLFYGRYMEYILAPIMLMGFWGLRKLEEPKKKISIVIAVIFLITFFFYFHITSLGRADIASVHIPGIAAYIGSLDSRDWKFYVYMGGGFCLNIIAISFVTLWKNENTDLLAFRRGLCLLVLAGEIFLANAVAHEKSYWGQTQVYEELALVDYLEEKQQRGSRIIYLNQGGAPWIDTIQFLKRDMKIDVYYPHQVGELRDSDIVLTLYNGETPERVKNLYGNANYIGKFYVYAKEGVTE